MVLCDQDIQNILDGREIGVFFHISCARAICLLFWDPRTPNMSNNILVIAYLAHIHTQKNEMIYGIMLSIL